MKSVEKDNFILIVLKSDEDFFSSIKDVSIKYDIQNGILLSAIGQIKNFKLGFYQKGKYLTKSYEKPHEIINLTGNIIKNLENNFEFHIHAVLSDENMNTIGGHFIGGIVELISEVFISKTNFEISRVFHNLSNTKRIVF